MCPFSGQQDRLPVLTISLVNGAGDLCAIGDLLVAWIWLGSKKVGYYVRTLPVKRERNGENKAIG